MKLVGLLSGGKDSCFNLIQCISKGHEVVALANLMPPFGSYSFMYQSVGSDAIEGIGNCMQLPLYRIPILGKANIQSLDYNFSSNGEELKDEDEVESLFYLLSYVKKKHPEIEGVASGAILSTYQRNRVENVCNRLGLLSVAYLWQRDQHELLREMITSGMEVILIKIAAMGLSVKKHLGKSIKDLEKDFHRLYKEYGLNVCGEGGEYESFTLNCSIFFKKINRDNIQTIIHSDDDYAPVAYLSILSFHLEDKDELPIQVRTSNSNSSSKSSVYVITSNDINEIRASIKQPLDPRHSITQDNKELLKKSLRIVFKKQLQNFYFHLIYFPSSNSTLLNKEEEVNRTIEQATIILESLKEQCDKEGLLTSHIYNVCIYLRDISHFVHLNNLYKFYFPSNPPARATLSTSLPFGCNITLECFASTSPSRNVLYVQSISSWAPANIGPYSQAYTVDNLIFLAGQIPLEAASMQLISTSDLTLQTTTTISNLENVMKCVKSNFHLVLSCIVFVKDISYVGTIQAILSKHLDSKSSFYRHPKYIEVTGLPKDAPIEILMINYSESIPKKELSINKSVGSFSHSLNGISFSFSNETIHLEHEENNILLANYFVEAAHNILFSSQQLIDLITTMIDNLSSLNYIKERKLIDKILCARSFYKQDCLQTPDPLEVQSHFYGIPFSFIPCKSFENSLAFLSIEFVIV